MIESILAVNRQAMGFERQRVESASARIASANVPMAASTSGAFSDALGPSSAEVRSVFDPGHPQADSQGFVHYPKVDLVSEMTTLLGASRSYEANVRAFNLLRGMELRALEIGDK